MALSDEASQLEKENEILDSRLREMEEREVELLVQTEQNYRNAYLDGYAAAVRALEIAFDGTNGYEVLGNLQGHFLKLQMWSIGSVDKKIYAPGLLPSQS